jgi:hypothetical protein
VPLVEPVGVGLASRRAHDHPGFASGGPEIRDLASGRIADGDLVRARSDSPSLLKIR